MWVITWSSPSFSMGVDIIAGVDEGGSGEGVGDRSRSMLSRMEKAADSILAFGLH